MLVLGARLSEGGKQKGIGTKMGRGSRACHARKHLGTQAAFTWRGNSSSVLGERPEYLKSCLTEWEGLGLFLVSECKIEAKESKSQRKLCFCL